MAASARWPAILEGLEQIGSKENILKLNRIESQSVRESVVLMLQSATKRFQNTNVDWVVEKGLAATLSAIIATKNAPDPELEALLMEFLRITVFPPSHYRLYKNDAEGQKYDDQLAEKEPLNKKAKLTTEKDEELKIKLWEQEEHYRSPSNALILCESLAEAYGRRVMTFPFYKILCATGFDQKSIPNPEDMTTGHCRLLAFFAKFVDRERLHLKGNRRSYTGNFIKNSLHALLVNESIDVLELEDVVNTVAELDPLILQQLNTILWKRWVQGELISVMIKMCSYFNQLQSSKKMFNQIFNLDLMSASNDLHQFFLQPFTSLTEKWLPSALISDMDFLTQTVVNLLKDSRLDDGVVSHASDRIYTVINIFIIAIGFELDALDIDHLTISVQDEIDLLQIMDRIASILERYQKVSKYWLLLTMKFWRIEKQRRLFLDVELNDNFLTCKMDEKLQQYSDVAVYGQVGMLTHFEIALNRLEWAVLHAGKVEKYSKRFCKIVLQLFGASSSVEIAPAAQQIMQRIIPIVFDQAPKSITRVVCHLCAYGPDQLGMDLIEDNERLLSSVVELINDTEEYAALLTSLPVVFFQLDDINTILTATELTPLVENLDLLYRLFSTPHQAAVMERFNIDYEFYTKLRVLISTNQSCLQFSHTKNLIKLTVRHLRTQKAECDRLSFVESEIRATLDDDTAQFFTHEWLMVILNEVKSKQPGSLPVAYDMSDAILAKTDAQFFLTQCDAVNLLLSCYRIDGETAIELSAERRAALTAFYDTLVIKLALTQPDSAEDIMLNSCLGRLFTLFGSGAEMMAFQLVKSKAISNGTITACWGVLHSTLLELRIKTIPTARYRIELRLALESINTHYKEKKDFKTQFSYVKRIFTILHKTDDFWLRYDICRTFLELKSLNKSNLLLRSILSFLTETPANAGVDVIRAIYTILNELFVHYSSKIIILAPAIIGVLKHYLELTERLQSDKETALSYFKRLVMFIRTHNDIKLKIGLSLGFLFPIFIRLQIVFPDGGLVEEILFLQFDILSEKQVLAFSAQLNESQKKRMAQSYDAWKKIKGETKRFMTV